ncbi:hypothetical protein AB8S08_02595 [Pseudidiomarina sp. PP-1MA]|uniref:Uncharacterized protein n=1 Tax=Pseudidiomarina sp. PP-1MA TaxID=3237706 RepID=A0AB39XBG6_9GAMM
MSKKMYRKVIINKDGSLALDLSDDQTRKSITESMSETNDDRIASLEAKLQRLRNEKASRDTFVY